MVFMGEINYPDICWKNYGVTPESSIKFLASVEGCFLMKMLNVPVWSEVLLDLVLTKE